MEIKYLTSKKGNSMDEKDLGKIFLFSKNKDFSKLEGGKGYTYSDGSGYFDGNNGEKIQIYSDGSGYYEDSSGGTGMIYSDGSGYFEGANGSKASKYSDGSGYFEDENGEITNYYSDNDEDEYDDYEEDDDDDDNEDESLGEILGKALFVAGVLGAQKIKSKMDEINAEEIRQQQRAIEKEKRKQQIKEKAKKSRNKRVKAFLFNRKNLMVGTNYSELIGEKFIVAEKWFKDVGFNNIKRKALEDIYISNEDDQWLISDITINGSNNFKEKDMFPYDSEIIIYYHSKKKINIPFSSKKVYKENSEKIISVLENIGFTNIKRIELDDLVTGWINKEDSIQSIKINQIEKFVENQSFNYDAEIKITYHTFTKKRRYNIQNK